MQPEMNQLSFAFIKLRVLSILGIFVEFDLAWTSVLLEAAPYVEILQIQVSRVCLVMFCQVEYFSRFETFLS